MVDFVVLVVCVVSLGFALAVFGYAAIGRRPDLVEVIRYGAEHDPDGRPIDVRDVV